MYNGPTMKWFLQKVSENVLQQWSREELIFKVIPHFLGDLMTKYFDIEVEGIENLPEKGAALIASNHSGFAGLDALLICHHIFARTKRTPRVLIHPLWFSTNTTTFMASKVGFIEATYKNGVETLNKQKLVLIFPEGENGNFKPTTKKYELQPFKSGMVRMGLETAAPIIPTLVIGAEEANINLAQFKLPKVLKGMSIPLPLNVIPLPTKWKIKFLPPVELSRGKEALTDDTYIRHTTEDLQDYMQIELNKELKNRKIIYTWQKD